MVYGSRILILSALLPGLFLLYKIYKADKLEPEPLGLMAKLVLFGVLSTYAAALAEGIGENVLYVLFPYDSLIYSLILYFVVVAGAEEGVKYLVLKHHTWKNSAFNCRFDGVVYAVAVSLGFALCENISYVFQYGLETAAVRAITAVPGHASFGVFMGAFYGHAKQYQLFGDEPRSKSCRRMALLVPMLLHGAYDFIATLTMELATLGFVVFVAAMFIVTLRLVKKMSRDDRYIAYRNQYWS